MKKTTIRLTMISAIAVTLTAGFAAAQTATTPVPKVQTAPAVVAAPADADVADQVAPPPPPPPPVPPVPGQAAQPPAARTPKVEKTPAPPAPPAPPGPPKAPGQLVNIRVDVTVTDQVSGKPQVSRTLSVTAADGQNASVRSNLVVPAGNGVIPTGFSLDAMPRIAEGARIRLELVLDYNSTDATGTESGGPRSPSSIRVRQEVILENGKPLVIAQPVDAMTDRKVTVEAKATILK